MTIFPSLSNFRILGILLTMVFSENLWTSEVSSQCLRVERDPQFCGNSVGEDRIICSICGVRHSPSSFLSTCLNDSFFSQGVEVNWPRVFQDPNVYRFSHSVTAQHMCMELVQNHVAQLCEDCSFRERYFLSLSLPRAVPPGCMQPCGNQLSQNQQMSESPNDSGRAGNQGDELEALTQQCESLASEMQSVCSQTPSNLESTLIQVGEQTSRALAQQASMVDACSNVAQYALAAQVAFQSARASCSASHDVCKSRCEAAKELKESIERTLSSGFNREALVSLGLNGLAQSPHEFNEQARSQVRSRLSHFGERIQKATRDCGRGSEHLRNLNRGIQELGQAISRSQQCANQNRSQPFSNPRSFEECRANPNQSGCEWYQQLMANSDLCKSDPSSMACFCQRFPGDARCGRSELGLNFKSGSPSGGNSGSGSSESATRPLPSPGLTGFGRKDDLEFSQNENSRGSNLQSGVSGPGFFGGGVGGSELTLNKPHERPNLQGSRKAEFQVQNSKGASGISRWLDKILGRKSSDFGGGGRPQGGSDPQGAPGLGSRVDLTRFLPQQRRGPSFVTGPDGITGPYSDNFKKINMRYIAVAPSLRALP